MPGGRLPSTPTWSNSRKVFDHVGVFAFGGPRSHPADRTRVRPSTPTWSNSRKVFDHVGVFAFGGPRSHPADRTRVRRRSIMWLNPLLRFLRRRSERSRGAQVLRAGTRRRSSTRRLSLEPLEDRCLLSASLVMDINLSGDSAPSALTS